MPSGCSTESDTDSVCSSHSSQSPLLHSTSPILRPFPYLQQPPIRADPGSFPTLGTHRAESCSLWHSRSWGTLRTLALVPGTMLR